MIVWKYVFLYTTVAMVAGFALTMLWHQWRYRVRGRRRATACEIQMAAASRKLAAADVRDRKSDEWVMAQSAALAKVNRDLKAIRA